MQDFVRVPQTQFIAACIDPVTGSAMKTSSGKGAETWGIWRVDPGPRGVRLEAFKQLEANGGMAPAKWKFDSSDWWLEEHGLIMEKPDFPLPAGRYIVTGGRETTAILTIGEDGSWSLEGSATLYDVTHLPCRSARYTPVSGASASCVAPSVTGVTATSSGSGSATGTPGDANPALFPVVPGGSMPDVPGTIRQDYAVIFVLGIDSKLASASTM